MKTNPDSLPSTPAALLPYCRDCRDLSEWPERWMGEEKDLPLGRKLVEYFMPFLVDLAGSGLSRRTIQNHVDNIWLLGGEIIRDVNEDPSLRKVAAEKLVRNVIHQDGARSSTTAGKTSSDPSTPPAANSTVSSLNHNAEPASYPQIPQTSPNWLCSLEKCPAPP